MTQEAYSHEVISFGFWPGDDTLGDAAYYAYTAPEPDGLREQSLSVGRVDGVGHRLAGDPPLRDGPRLHPRRTLLAFCQSRLRSRRPTRRLGHPQLRIDMVPTPGQLRELYANAAADLGRKTEQA